MRVLLSFTFFVFGATGFAVPIFAFAHEPQEATHSVRAGMEAFIKTTSLETAAIAAAVLALLVSISLMRREQSEFFKKLVFFLMVVAIVVPTVYFVGGTIYLNLISVTRGPVHWHADFRIFACGEELQLKESEGWSNKVGTSVFHHHNDNRIHIEGVVVDPRAYTLHDFFSVIGGTLLPNSFAVPAQDGIRVWKNGDLCPDGAPGEWQAFLYKTTDPERGIAHQRKLASYTDYVISPYGTIPPGDCIIFEFGPPKEKTDAICSFYQIAKDKGEIEIQF